MEAVGMNVATISRSLTILQNGINAEMQTPKSMVLSDE